MTTFASETARDPLPHLAIEPLAARRTGEVGHWLLTWNIENQGPESAVLLDIWLPHGGLRAPAKRLDPPQRLAGGQKLTLEVEASFHAPPGTVIENTFLIIRLLSRDRHWRLFARHRVTAGPDGTPHPVCEAISVHPIGTSTPDERA